MDTHRFHHQIKCPTSVDYDCIMEGIIFEDQSIKTESIKNEEMKTENVPDINQPTMTNAKSAHPAEQQDRIPLISDM